jgi:leader peptidase (prepilin peptidase)/N-methyltransferase
MGFGDVKLGAMLGAWLGWRLGAVSLFLAVVGGAIGGVIIALAHRRKIRGRAADTGSLRVPFGTFLATAGIVTAFVGQPLLRWYLGLFP